MKMVIVFDTEDPQGMKDAYRMIMYLAQRHMDLDPAVRVELTRVQLMKALKDFSRENFPDNETNLNDYLKFANDVIKKYGISKLPEVEK